MHLKTKSGQLTIKEKRLVEKSKSFTELKDVALEVIKRMGPPVGMVSGPITNGGLGTKKKNLERFQKKIKRLQSYGYKIFSQMPFEKAMARLKKSGKYSGDRKLLEDFYLPIFKSGLVDALYFIKGWQSSYGACWEHVQARRLGIRIVYI